MTHEMTRPKTAQHLRPVRNDWHAGFFTEFSNEFWRRMATPEMTVGDVDFVVRSLNLHPGSSVLDVPCGSGRHSLELARRGYRVQGYDISVEAVTVARRIAAAEDLDLSLEVSDMRRIPSGEQFDAAVCLGNSFGYLDLDGTQTFLRALARAVRPGGGVVIDATIAAECLLPGFTGAARTMRAGDITVQATTEYDVDNSRLVSTYHYTRGAQQWEGTALHHLYTSAHLGHLLTDAGFTDVQRYAPDGSPFQVGGRGLMLVARRG